MTPPHVRTRASMGAVRGMPTLPVTVPQETIERIEDLVSRAGGVISRGALLRAAVHFGLRQIERDPGVLFAQGDTSRPDAE
jgi:hypothetical protein